jgi:hypothetical protein
VRRQFVASGDEKFTFEKGRLFAQTHDFGAFGPRHDVGGVKKIAGKQAHNGDAAQGMVSNFDPRIGLADGQNGSIGIQNIVVGAPQGPHPLPLHGAQATAFGVGNMIARRKIEDLIRMHRVERLRLRGVAINRHRFLQFQQFLLDVENELTPGIGDRNLRRQGHDFA